MKQKPEEPPPPRWVLVIWWIRATFTWWPWQVRQLRAAGFRRTGWRTWEYRP